MSKAGLFLVGLCLFLSASSQTTAPAGTIKIGTFLSLTGSTATYGVSASKAIKLATDEVNRSGGVHGKLIELVVEDDHSNTHRTRTNRFGKSKHRLCLHYSSQVRINLSPT